MSAPWWDPNYKDLIGPEYRCYVSNLPFSADAFASYNPLIAEVVYDRETGRSRGFGFVQFDDESSMNNAVQGMYGQQLGGRNITVSRAKDRPRRWKA
ncbi:hypothetical protein QOZ80_2AG0129270 [Eleusine coracana subsp. coracana]|nr:hypothetical protein QOZ80_2AG0129270 [Eleusine coracana subsp. coracana]